MKLFALILGIATACGISYGTYAALSRTPAPPEERPVLPPPPVEPTGGDWVNRDPEYTALIAKVERLSRRVEELEMEVTTLRATGREVVESTEGSPEPAPPLANRQVVEDVLAEIESERAAQREAEREARDRQRTLDRAKRLAEEHGLDAAGEKALADVLFLQEDQWRVFRDRIAETRDLPRDERETLVRDAFAEIGRWRLQELTTRFGPATAETLHAALTPDRGRRRGDAGRAAGDE